jgi:SpoVK/Ycf46/Vps4 family AAA+-type ATPase
MGKKRPNDDSNPNDNNKRPPLFIHLINLIENNKKNNENNDNDNDNDNNNDNTSCDGCNNDENDNNNDVTVNLILDDKCLNPRCDHIDYTRKEKLIGFDKLEFLNIPEKDIDSIDDLIEMGYQYHCKKRKIYKGIDLKRLFNLIEPLTELKNLVGMKSVKESMVDQILFFLQKLNKKEKCNVCINCNNNLKCNEVKTENEDMLHTIITGPPGVGKTELGKILGKVYKAMGVLSKGHVMIAKRPDLIAKYLGQTAPKTQAFIDKCKGGVMFIDEAYSLGNPEGRDSFSKECIDTLNQNLTERRDFLCIIAGYEDSLESSFFSFNEGLKRRFSFKYVVDKYTGSELKEIFLIKVKKEDWIFLGNHDDLDSFFRKNVEYFPRFGGDVETLFLKVKIAHSRRVMFKDEDLRKKITMEDIKKGYEKFTSHRKTKEDLPEKILTMYT